MGVGDFQLEAFEAREFLSVSASAGSSNNPNTQTEGIDWHSLPGAYFIRVSPAGAVALSYRLQFVTFPMQ